MNRFLLFIAILWGYAAQAGQEPTLTQRITGEQMVDDGTFTVADDKYSCLDAGTCAPTFTTVATQNALILGSNPDYDTCTTPWTVSYELLVEIWTWNGNSYDTASDTVTLSLSYNPAARTDYGEQAVHRFTDAAKVKVTIVSYSSTYGTNDVPPNAYLEALIQNERYYDFNHTTVPDFSSASTNGAEELTLSWNAMAGAEEYDLEWYWVDDTDYDAVACTTGYRSAANIPWSFKNNASRVTVTGTSYTLKLIYEHGYLVYRLRGVGRHGTDFTQRKEGAWSSATVSGSFLDTYTDKYFVQSEAHEEKLNWQWTASFAEEGKKALVISYFDGSLRSRQTVSYNHTDDYTIVGEQIYDHLGRPAIQALPVPTDDDEVRFYHGFNANNTNKQYSWQDFELHNAGDTCANIAAAPMSTGSGAARYYSASNPDLTAGGLLQRQQSYVPMADGYPFVHTEYMPDHTGRIRRQGGAGPDHQLGTGHETRYYYGTPDQEELDRLFGNEAGRAIHYKKHMVIDANGQVSLSFLDPRGKVVATALAGAVPEAMDTLATHQTADTLMVNMMAHNMVDSLGGGLTAMHTLLIAAPDTVELRYTFGGETYEELTCNNNNVCYDCLYDLTITVHDACGVALYSHTSTLPALDTLCNAGGYTVNASVFLPEPGSYTVYKTLNLSARAEDYYAEVYTRHYTCLPSLDTLVARAKRELDYEGCSQTCDECLDELGTYTAYEAQRKAEYTTAEWEADSVNLRRTFGDEYTLMEAYCGELCDTPSTCEPMYYMLLQDISPGGQYGHYSYDSLTNVFTATDLASIFTEDAIGTDKDWKHPATAYLDANGDTAKVLINGVETHPEDLASLDLFMQHWQPSWAASLLPHHPEYCFYEFCISNDSSDLYDYTMATTGSYGRADTLGLLDPLMIDHNLSSSIYNFHDTLRDPYFYWEDGVSDSSAAITAFNAYASDGTNDYTLWDLAAITVFCPDPDNDAAAMQTCLTNHPFGSGTAAEKDRQWEVFRSLYRSLKQEQQEARRTANGCTNCAIGTGYTYDSCTTPSAMADQRRLFPKVGAAVGLDRTKSASAQLADLEALVADGLEAACAEQCRAYADQWINTLAGCPSIASHEDTLRARLIRVCQSGCDVRSPLGSRNTAWGGTSDYTSFEAVFQSIWGPDFDYTSWCNPDLVSAPGGYGHDYLAGDSVLMDSCFAADFKGLVNTWMGAECSANNGLIDDMSTYLNDTVFVNPFPPTGTTVDGTTGVLSTSFDHNGQSCDLVLYPNSLSGFDFDNVIDVYYIINTIDSNCCAPDDRYYFTAFINYDNGGITENLELVGYNSCDTVCSTAGASQSLAAYLETERCFILTDAQIARYQRAICDPTVVAYIPTEFSCKPRCITCDTYAAVQTAFTDQYPDLTADSANYDIIRQNFYNTRLGFNLAIERYDSLQFWCDRLITTPEVPEKFSFKQYRKYQFGCDTTTGGDRDTLYHYLLLCNEPIATPLELDTSDCVAWLDSVAWYNARQRLAYLQDSLMGAFRTHYRQKCLEAMPQESFTLTVKENAHHYTLYYYDQAENLTRTVPPAGVDILTLEELDDVTDYRDDPNGVGHHFTVPTHTLVTYYAYNTLNQLIEQRTPDAGTSKFWYDRLGRLAVSQSARQLAATGLRHHYSYTEYDGLGRITEVGELAQPADMTVSLARDPALLESWIAGGDRSEITRTYYDTSYSAAIATRLGSTDLRLRNRVAAVTYTDLEGEPYAYASFYRYDIHGNVQHLLHDYAPLSCTGYHFFSVQYDYDLISGNVNEVCYQAGQPDQLFHRYGYDADNRLLKAESSRDGLRWLEDAHYFYYRHGPLARVELGDLKVQGLDYVYTLQGWLKGLNSNTLDSTRDPGRDGWQDVSNARALIPMDVVGFSLGYFEGDYEDIGQLAAANRFEATYSGSAMDVEARDLYNGNIRYMVTAIGKFMEQGEAPLGYTYHYDQLNRLTRMDAWDNLDRATNAWGATGDALTAYHNRFTYDGNGNILTQVRRGGTIHGLGLDSLTYHYVPGTNRLDHVSDGIAASAYDDDLDAQNTCNYPYDESGFLVGDLAEGIAYMGWTAYGKLARVNRTGCNGDPDLFFQYGTDGQRTRKQVTHRSGYVYSDFYVRDAQGNVMAVYRLDEHDPRIDTSYVTMMGELDSLKMDSSVCFVADVYTEQDTFYVGLEDFLPGPELVDRFSMAEFYGCVNNGLYPALFSCCDTCQQPALDTLVGDFLQLSDSLGDALAADLLACKGHALLTAILTQDGTNFLNGLGTATLDSLKTYFKDTRSYPQGGHGSTHTFLLEEIPLSELVAYLQEGLAAQLELTEPDLQGIYAEIMDTMEARGAALQNYFSTCDFLECLPELSALHSYDTLLARHFRVMNDTCTFPTLTAEDGTEVEGFLAMDAGPWAFTLAQVYTCDTLPFQGLIGPKVLDSVVWDSLAADKPDFWCPAWQTYDWDRLLVELFAHNADDSIISQLFYCDMAGLLTALGRYNSAALYEAIYSSEGGKDALDSAYSRFLPSYSNATNITDTPQYLATYVPLDSMVWFIHKHWGYDYRSDIWNGWTGSEQMGALSEFYRECDSCLKNAYGRGDLELVQDTLLAELKRNHWPQLLHDFYGCDSLRFVKAVGTHYPEVIAGVLEHWHLPVGRFMTDIETYFGAETRWALDSVQAPQRHDLMLAEHHLYGSSRLGVLLAKNDTVAGQVKYFHYVRSQEADILDLASIDTLGHTAFDTEYTLYRGRKRLELSNHLGNVLAVVSDKRLAVCDGNEVLDHYQADLLQAQDYYPFGALMKERTWYGDSTTLSEDSCVSCEVLHGHLNTFLNTYGFSGLDNQELVRLKFNQYLGITFHAADSFYTAFNRCQLLKDSMRLDKNLYLDFGDEPQYRVGKEDFSLSTRIYLENISTRRVFLSNRHELLSTEHIGYSLWYLQNDHTFRLTLEDGLGGKVEVYTDATGFLDQWIKLTVVKRGSSTDGIHFYINGIEQTVSIASNTLTSWNLDSLGHGPLRYGSWGGSDKNDNFKSGYISDIRMYGRALSKEEVVIQDTLTCDIAPIIRHGLILWAPLNEGRDKKVYDYSDFKETGTMIGTSFGSAVWSRDTTDVSCQCVGDGLCFSIPKTEYVSYRFGFNGMEMDHEVNGFGNSLTTEFRQYDPRLGKWLSTDPAANKYPQYSPYNSFNNNPLFFTDPRGDEPPQEAAKHTVAAGETLWDIAKSSFKEYGGKQTFEEYWQNIQEWNKNLDYEKIGTKIYLTNPHRWVAVANGLWKDEESPAELWQYNSADGWIDRNQTYGEYFDTDPEIERSRRAQTNKKIITYGMHTFYYIGGRIVFGPNRPINYNKRFYYKPIRPQQTAIGAAKGAGTALQGVDDVIANPQLLQGQSLNQVKNLLGNSKGWVNDVMRRSTTNPNGGWVLREMNKAGTDFTGRMIQYHPGTPRHFGGAPYWKVSSGSETVRIPLNP